MLAVNAGYQVLGTSFVTADGTRHDGLGLDVRSSRAGSPFQGPVITRPDGALGLAALSGFDRHHGTGEVGAGAEPFVALGLGHGSDGAHDGPQGHVIGATCTGRSWPATPTSPTCCSARRRRRAGAGTGSDLRRPACPAGRGGPGRPSGWGGQLFGGRTRRSRPSLRQHALSTAALSRAPVERLAVSRWARRPTTSANAAFRLHGSAQQVPAMRRPRRFRSTITARRFSLSSRPQFSRTTAPALPRGDRACSSCPRG